LETDRVNTAKSIFLIGIKRSQYTEG